VTGCSTTTARKFVAARIGGVVSVFVLHAKEPKTAGGSRALAQLMVRIGNSLPPPWVYLILNAYVHIWTSTHTHVYTCIVTRGWEVVHVCMRKGMYVLCMYVCMYMRMHTCVCVYIYNYIHVYIHVYVHIRTRLHILCVCMYVCVNTYDICMRGVYTYGGCINRYV